MIDRIATVWIPVSDMDRAKQFYAGTLGLQTKTEQEVWTEFDVGGVTVALNAREEEQAGVGGPGGPIVALRPSGSLEDEVERLKGEGVEFPAEISDHPWGRVATFKDPDGNDLQLYAPPQG